MGDQIMTSSFATKELGMEKTLHFGRNGNRSRRFTRRVLHKITKNNGTQGSNSGCFTSTIKINRDPDETSLGGAGYQTSCSIESSIV